MTIYESSLNWVFSAQFTIEAKTPLSIGSGDVSYTTDRLIAKDIHGLPYIPGSGLAGVLRHEMGTFWRQEEVDDLFGNEAGSRLILSSGHLLGADGKTVIEGVQDINPEDPFFQIFQKLPERDHVRITHKGAADVEGHGKFDEEVVYKGTRFVFSIDLLGKSEDKDVWESLLDLIFSPLFRIGGGTRKGFGALKIIQCHERFYHLTDASDLKAYMQTSSSLNRDLSDWSVRECSEAVLQSKIFSEKYHTFELDLRPESFFYFGAGYGDCDADMVPKKEFVLTWGEQGLELNENNKELLETYYLIPASSVKGAIAHRVAYHFNLLKKNFLLDTDKDQPFPELNIKSIVQQLLPEINENSLPQDSQDAAWDELIKSIEQISASQVYETENWAAFHRNCETYRNNLPQGSLKSNPYPENTAVRELFGEAKSDTEGMRGRVLLSDVYLEEEKVKTKIFNHVKIDRFTGGAVHGALYNEKTIQSNPFLLTIFVDKKAFDSDDDIRIAFDNTLEDLKHGNLQVGGNTTKGHGALRTLNNNR